MKVVTTEQIRALDRQTIAAGTPGLELMERAGFAVARTAARLLKERQARRVVLLAGKGNNGGDAFVAARHLAAAGCEPVLVLLADPTDLRGDAAAQFERMIGVRTAEWGAGLEPGDLVIDGLLGTGLTGPVRAPYDAAIRWMNQIRAPILAIDIPSGLDSDTGEVHGEAVRAAVTVTMGLPKRGLLCGDGVNHAGQIEVAEIGFPADLIAELKTDLEMITATEIAPLFPCRARRVHKGSFGHLLIIAGAEGYTGAPVLCARAAARSGVGLVTVAVPDNIYRVVAAACPPEVMPRPLEKLLNVTGFTAVAIGPGLGQGEEIQKQIFHWIGASHVPVVLDADGLNALSAHLDFLDTVSAPLVLTPHPGEMGRLLGVRAHEIEADRAAAVRRLTHAHNVTLLLKGAATLIGQPTGPLWINSTGNPGMARGGMGDALTGMIGAFLAQGMTPLDAARAGAYLHGLAGDLARARWGEVAMQTSDLIEELGTAFQQLR